MNQHSDEARQHPGGQHLGGQGGQGGEVGDGGRGEPGPRARAGWSGEVPPQVREAIVAGAAWLADALLVLAEASVAALLGAASGAGQTARGIWEADRPRRQMVRVARRRRWWAARGWRRAAVVAEVITVGAWIGSRAAVRAVRGMPAGAARGGREGWETGRTRARTRRTPPTADSNGEPKWQQANDTDASPGPAEAGELIVDGEVLCGRPGCGQALAPGDREELCPTCRQPSASPVTGQDAHHQGDVIDGQVVEDDYDAAATGSVPARVVVEQEDPEPGREPTPAAAGSRRWDRLPETDEDRRFFDLRETGYRSWINKDGYAVDAEGRRREPEEIAAIIAAGGYPPDQDPWGVPLVAAATTIDTTGEDDAPVQPLEVLEELADAQRRTQALRAAGWEGPIDVHGHAVTVWPSWHSLPGLLAVIEGQATHPPQCCRCVRDPSQPQEDQVAYCSCTFGEGGPIEQCTCGPWDLAAALAREDAAEDRGELAADDRVTCHSCRAWADHAHAPWTGRRITVWEYRLQQLLREHPDWRPTTTELPAGHPAAGSNEHDEQEDAMSESESEMTITTGTGSGGQVSGGSRMGRQLGAIGDLRAEVTEMRTCVEVGSRMLADLEGWAAGLPEQVAAAEWSTEQVTRAAVGLAQARIVEELREGITDLQGAVTQAARLGEQLAAGGARGGVAGLRPQ